MSDKQQPQSDEFDRCAFESKLTSLQEATSNLMEINDPEEIATQTCCVASDLLDIPLTSIHLYNRDTDELTPTAYTEGTEDVLGEPPVFDGSNDSLAWDNFQNENTEYYRDVSDNNTLNDDTPIVSELHIPLNGYGLFIAGTTDGEMDTSYGRRELVKILASTTEVAFERADQLQQLEEYKQELEETVQELEQSNEELKQFAYIASHDLQEPLRMISSYLQLLEMEYGGELGEDADEYIDYAVDGAERMQRLIDDLLKFSRVGDQNRELEEVALNSLLEDVRDDLSIKIDENDATVTVDDLPTVQADSNQLLQLFQNLIKNSIDYAKDDTPPEIDVTVSDEGDEYEFAVADNGQGIPDDQREKIFQVFTRGDGETDDEGTGIGLAVVQRIVEGHEGEIWVDSAVGEGTTFYFTLPKHGDTE